MQLITRYDYPEYTEPLDYHCIWFGGLLDHHILCLSSLFATQRNPRVTLWTDAESYPNLTPLRERFVDRFDIRIGTFRENAGYGMTVFRSDKWRLQILKEYGGIYFDMDIVFFKDISWFVNYGKPIVHEGYTAEKAFNNAILYYPKSHPGLEYWLQRIGDGFFGWSMILEIQKMSDENFGADMLPNTVSDRGWGAGGPSCDDFFEKPGLTHECMCDSFLYHWHNRWTKSLHNPGTLVNYYWNKYVTTPTSSGHV
jgi:hypothetical protein